MLALILGSIYPSLNYEKRQSRVCTTATAVVAVAAAVAIVVDAMGHR